MGHAMHRPLGAIVAGLCASILAASPCAALTTLRISLTATDFSQVFGSSIPTPYPTVTEELTLTFDPTAVVAATQSGLTINQFTLSDSSNYSYNPSGETLTVGSDTGENSYGLNPSANQYGFNVDSLLSSHAFIQDFEYSYGAHPSLWIAQDVTFSIVALPEAPDWVLLILAVAAAGAGLRVRRRTLPATL